MLLSHMLKLIDTRGHEETFKSHHAGCKHRRELASVSRNHATPKTHVNETIVARGFQFDFEGGERRRRRNGIERHVDDSRHTTRSCGKRRTAKTFPLGPSRRVDVNMRIDESRHHE